MIGQLTWYTVEEGHLLDYICCMCGKKNEEEGFEKSDITIAAKATVTIYICGERCKRTLLNDKMSMIRLDASVKQARKAHRKWALKKMGRRFGVVILLSMLMCCTPKAVQHKPRYRQDDDKALNAWLDAEYPRKMKPTVHVKKKKFKTNK